MTPRKTEHGNRLVACVRILLRDDGATVRDIAEQLDCTERHVRVCLDIARQLFGAQLQRDRYGRWHLASRFLRGSRVAVVEPKAEGVDAA